MVLLTSSKHYYRATFPRAYVEQPIFVIHGGNLPQNMKLKPLVILFKAHMATISAREVVSHKYTCPLVAAHSRQRHPPLKLAPLANLTAIAPIQKDCLR